MHSIEHRLTKRSVGSIALAALLILGTYAILPLTTSAYAQTSTITTSADAHGGKFFGRAWLEVFFQSSQHASDTTAGNIQVTVNAFGATQTFQLSETGTTSGIFLMYVRVDNDNGKVDAEEPITIFSPFAATNTHLVIGTGVLNSGGGIDYPTPGGSTLAGMDATPLEGGSITFSALGVSKTITWDDSSASVTLDRTSYGPSSTIIPLFKDQDANLDPTRADTLTETAAPLVDIFVDGGATDDIPTVELTLTETGTNTATFKVTSTTISAGALAAGQDSVSRSITANDRSVYTAGVNGTTVNPGTTIIGTSSASYTVTSQRGQIQPITGSSLSYASELPARVNDLDRNTNSESEQSYSGILRVLVDGTVTGSYNLNELNLNSNVFKPNYSGDDIDLTFGSNTDVNQGILEVLPGQDVTLQYIDAFYLPGTNNFLEATGFRLDLNGDGDTTDNIAAGTAVNETNIRMDLDSNGAISGTVNGIIEGQTRVDLNGDGDFADSFTIAASGWNEATQLVRLDINGDGNTLGTVTPATALLEINMRLDLNNDNIAGSSSVAGINEADTRVDLNGIDFLGITSQTTFEIANTAPTLQADRTTASGSSIIQLTLRDRDLNDDAGVVESYTVNFAGSTAATTVNLSGNDIFSLEIKVSGTTRTLGAGAFTVTFTETGANTGNFTTQVNLQQLKNAIGGSFAFTDGDTVEFKIVDRLEPGISVRPEAKASITIGLAKPSLTVDRSTIGVPRPTTPAGFPVTDRVVIPTGAVSNLGNARIEVTITDPALNINSLAEDMIVPTTGATTTDGNGVVTFANKLRISLFRPDGAVFGNGSVSVTTAIRETGFDTGVFKGVIEIASNPSDTPEQWIGARATIAYAGADNVFGNTDDADSTSVTFTARNAVLTTSSTVVANGQRLTITVQDPDADRDPTTAEQVSIAIRWVDDAGATQNQLTTLDETGASTGIFTKNIDVGTSTVGTLVMRVAPDEEVNLRYYDLTPSIAGASEWPLPTSSQTQIDLDLTSISSSGGLTVTPEVVGPATELKVVVADTDLNTKPSSTQTITGRVTVISDRGSASRLDVTIRETGPNTGQFDADVQLAPADASGGFTAGAAGVTASGALRVLPGDLVSVRYEDEKGANGGRTTVTKTVEVVSVDPEIKADKSQYAIGDTIKVTIADLDANRDPDTTDILTLRVFSTTDAVGLTNVQAIETGPNTGTFIATIPTSRTFSTGALQVSNGDTVTVEYEDAFPKAFRQKFDVSGTLAGSSQKFKVTVTVGTAAGIQSTTPAAPRLTDLQGREVTEVKAGDQITVGTTVKNNDAERRPFVAVIQVIDEDGFTAAIGFAGGELAPSGTSPAFISFTPERSGTYTVKIFVLSGLGSPVILSSPVEKTITVS